MDGKRLGRDFKLYGLMEMTSDLQVAIADFAVVLFKINQEHPGSFQLIRPEIENWKNVFDGEMQQKWIELWG